jgi:predicted PurR-regulated permease PerM
MLALLVGGNMWGISGMILFVPLIAMLKVVLDNIPTLAPYGYLLGEGEETKAAKTENSWWLRIKELVKRK